MCKLKYIGYAIGLQEVPDEISLIFNVSGCPYHCDGCHSQYLWEYMGRYLSDDFLKVLDDNLSGISCVCFMGGDQNIEELKTYLSYIKSFTQLKTCIYSGCDELRDDLCDLLDNELLNYLKIGSYKKEYGGLNKINTNQRMYKYCGKNRDGSIKLEDITYLFKTKISILDNQYTERIS